MLHLINKSKVGRNIISSDINWKTIFKTSEDSFTSSIFGLLFYLPVELLWKIIRNACYDNKLPAQSGRLLSYEFWPHWNGEQTPNSNFIEPDIIVIFEEFDLIIEAKRSDYNQQNSNQWKGEIQSYFNEFRVDKPVFLIAVGGINKRDELATEIHNVMIIRCRWDRLLNEVKDIYEQLKRVSNVLNSNDSIINILNDLIIAFAVHGFLIVELFESMPTDISIAYTPDLI